MRRMSAGLFLHFTKENLAYLSLIAYDEGNQPGRKGPFSFSGDKRAGIYSFPNDMPFSGGLHHSYTEDLRSRGTRRLPENIKAAQK